MQVGYRRTRRSLFAPADAKCRHSFLKGARRCSDKTPGRCGDQMKQKRVAIVGAGATGLSAALWLHDHSDLQYDVYEASNQVGGKIVTYKDRGFVIEGGADSYLERKASMTHFIQRVGLGDSLVRNEVGQSYILKSGTLFPTPKNTVLGIPTDIDAFLETKLISDEGKRNLLKEYEKPRFAKPGEDVSAGAFLNTA